MNTMSSFSSSPTSAPLVSPPINMPTTNPVSIPAAPRPANPTKKTKPRKRVNTAEKRHQHNAIERQRRETLNGKFIVLARLLPALASSRRPSKSAIVNGSISHLTYQREQRLLAAKLLRQMSSEHDALLNEVNEWRKANGFALKEAATAGWRDEVEEICNVEKETFGTFANVDGEDAEEDDNDNENEFNFDQVASSFTPAILTQSTGLITPRPSTDIDLAGSANSLFGNMAAPETRCSTASSANASAARNSINWANDFTWNNTLQPNATVFPSANFLADFVADNSNTDSPGTSQQGAVVTPPFSLDPTMNQTPSPHSSNGFPASLDDVKPVFPTPQQQSQQSTWTAMQILFAHQQLQLQRQQAQQTASLPALPQGSGIDFSAMFPSQQSVSPTDTNMFTQQLMSSMFGGNSTPTLPGQVDQWRKNALNALPQQRPVHHQSSVHDLRNTVKLGMGAAGASQWLANQAVEGF